MKSEAAISITPDNGKAPDRFWADRGHLDDYGFAVAGLLPVAGVFVCVPVVAEPEPAFGACPAPCCPVLPEGSGLPDPVAAGGVCPVLAGSFGPAGVVDAGTDSFPGTVPFGVVPVGAVPESGCWPVDGCVPGFSLLPK